MIRQSEIRCFVRYRSPFVPYALTSCWVCACQHRHIAVVLVLVAVILLLNAISNLVLKFTFPKRISPYNSIDVVHVRMTAAVNNISHQNASAHPPRNKLHFRMQCMSVMCDAIEASKWSCGGSVQLSSPHAFPLKSPIFDIRRCRSLHMAAEPVHFTAHIRLFRVCESLNEGPAGNAILEIASLGRSINALCRAACAFCVLNPFNQNEPTDDIAARHTCTPRPNAVTALSWDVTPCNGCAVRCVQLKTNWNRSAVRLTFPWMVRFRFYARTRTRCR